jgi:hypothetical protein
MPAIALGLRALGFNRVCTILGTGLPPAVCVLACEDDQRLAANVARLVGLAARHGLPRSSCLPRSLTLWRLLRSRGIEARLRFGVRTEDGRLDAHAWVEHGGRPLNDASDVGERYAAFDGSAVLP